MSPIFEIYKFQKKVLRDVWVKFTLSALCTKRISGEPNQLDLLKIMNKTLVKSAAK